MFIQRFYSFFENNPAKTKMEIPSTMISPLPLSKPDLIPITATIAIATGIMYLTRLYQTPNSGKETLPSLVISFSRSSRLKRQPAKIHTNIPPTARKILSVSKSKISNAPVSNSFGPTPPSDSEAKIHKHAITTLDEITAVERFMPFSSMR